MFRSRCSPRNAVGIDHVGRCRAIPAVKNYRGDEKSCCDGPRTTAVNATKSKPAAVSLEGNGIKIRSANAANRLNCPGIEGRFLHQRRLFRQRIRSRSRLQGYLSYSLVPCPSGILGRR